MLVALALHCMGMPDGWQGSPQQALSLPTAFHAFLGQLPPVLEAAQQAVICQGCQLSLDVAAWQVGGRCRWRGGACCRWLAVSQAATLGVFVLPAPATSNQVAGGGVA